MNSSLKTVRLVAIEAIVVGICLVAFVKLVRYLYDPKDEMMLLFIAGVLFHIIFEYSGINLWYSIEYCKLQKT
jgi:hypothetical protein